MRHGATIAELIVALMIVGVVLAFGVPRVSALRDQFSVQAAARETVATFALGRRWALSRSARTAITVDTANATLLVRSFADTVALRRLGSSHGVALASTRDSMAYAPNGLGYGAANLSIIIRRGERAETIFVSRLGRVRR